MPMFIPVIVAFAGVASGAVVGFAAYAAVAGAVLSTVGALTGNKDLMRIGAVVGVVGGISGLASGGASAGASEAVSGMDLAADAGNGANSIGGAAAAVDTAQGVNAATSTATPGAVPPPATAPPTPTTAVAPPDAVTTGPTTGGASLADVAAKNTATAAPTAVTPADAMSSYQALENQAASPLSKAASNYTSSDLSSWWDKAMAAGKTVGKGAIDFAKQNPELVKIGGQVLMSMNDPQREALEYQQSLMEQARRNINSPVVLGYNKPK